MKILYFGNSFGSFLDTFINSELGYFGERNKIKALCLKPVKEFEIEDLQKIEFKRNKIESFLQFRLYKHDIFLTFKNNWFKKELNKVIKEFEPDIIHCHFGYNSLMVLDNYKGNIPIIMHFHGYDASKCLRRQSYIRRINKYLNRENVYPIYVSEFMKRSLEEKGLDVSKGMKLHYGIDLTIFEPKPKSDDHKKFTFLQVSTLVEKKGIDATLKAFARFLENKNKEDYQLILTGDNPEHIDKYRLLSKELGISESVMFFGKANREEVYKLMNTADVFVHHSVTPSNGDKEGIPNSIMEAMAMKLPVISTFHSGIPELVEDQVNGYLVDEYDVETYAKRMDDILDWGLKDENRLKVEEKFNYQIHNQLLEKFYLKILESK